MNISWVQGVNRLLCGVVTKIRRNCGSETYTFSERKGVVYNDLYHIATANTKECFRGETFYAE